jgi:hypothetical protein
LVTNSPPIKALELIRCPSIFLKIPSLYLGCPICKILMKFHHHALMLGQTDPGEISEENLDDYAGAAFGSMSRNNSHLTKTAS